MATRQKLTKKKCSLLNEIDATAQDTKEHIDTIYALVDEGLRKVDTLIQLRLQSNIELVNQLGCYIINSGGKRLRPIILLLSASAFNYQGDQHYNLAAIIEFIHTATLLHDDVVDASALRRGQVTANRRWGSAASILVGDFFYSKAFQMMVDTDSMQVMLILSNATNAIAAAEVRQLTNTHNPDITEAYYLNVVCDKTAKLFQAAAQLAAVISEQPEKQIKAIAKYGQHLGIAFQLIDDVLDYSATSFKFGKKIGSDLIEGKPTLPLLYAMRHSSKKKADIIRCAIKKGGTEKTEIIQRAVKETEALKYTINLAKHHINIATTALDTLVASKYREALYKLARLSIKRHY